MQAVLARIDAVNPRVNAFVTLARDAALREARRATAGLRRKENITTDGRQPGDPARAARRA